ncbi:MAG: FtsX-like permease family protein [Gemmatimonadota bacterium]
MRFPNALEIALARRYLRGSRRGRGMALNTAIATGGVAVGVMALIVVLGIMNGLRDDLTDRILIANPHLRVLTFGPSLRFEPWRGALDTVLAEPGVVAASPEVITQSVARNRAGYVSAVNIIGLPSDTGLASVTTIPQAITQGDLQFRTTSDSVDGGIILGYRLAERMSLYQGDLVELVSSASARVNPALGTVVPKFWRFEVVGRFDTGMFQYDDAFAIMSLERAQAFDGLGEAITGIQIQVTDPWLAPAIGKRLEGKLGYPYRTLDWQAQNATLFSALQLEKLGMGLIICFIMVVAAFNIVGTLIMMVADKTREIGILRAMGMSAGAIRRVFLVQGGIIGLIGTTIGLGLGLVVAYLIDASGVIRIDPAIYFIDHLPVHIEWLDVLAVVLTSLTVALLATVHPSRVASALEPVDAIRHE